MAIKGVKAKGDQFERDLCAYFSEKLGVEVFRSLYTKDPTMKNTVGACDLMGVPALAVEAKRVEKLSFPAAYAQALRNAAVGEYPVVINRRLGTHTYLFHWMTSLFSIKRGVSQRGTLND